MGCGGTGDRSSLPGLLALDTKHPDDQSIFRSGSIEDDYEVEKEPIARGKFASVRLARHRASREVFAAKFVRRRRRAANLEEEARHEVAVLLLGRSSPHIVQLHQVFETRSEYIIILEFGEGGDLQRLLDDQGRLSEKTVQDLLRQVLKGLGYLHQRRIAHLDIKPQNLILMGGIPEEGVKLVDFGLSRVIHQDTELTQIMGTPDYVAPEVINFEPVGLATDMWSIGVLTYVLLTGCTPFGGDNDQETFVNITKGDFDFPDDYFGDISEPAKDFISSLLIKSTNQRMNVPQCASHPWLSDLLDPHRLSQLSEADSADSGYSTDMCSGSPPSPGTLPNGFVSDLCQFTIPEDRQMSSHELSPHPFSNNKQFRPHHQLHRLGEDDVDRGDIHERKPKLSAARLSMNVLECLQAQNRPHSRPLRRSSLVIPRRVDDLDHLSVQVFGTENGFFDYDENRNSKMSLSSNHLNHSFSPKMNGWRHPLECSDLFRKNQYEHETLSNGSKPWNNLCSGSYSRAISQLKTPKKGKLKTNLGLRPELSCSMFELKSNHYPDFFSPQHEIRKPYKKELRGPKKDLFNSKAELRNSRNDLRGSTLSLDVQNMDMNVSISDIQDHKSNFKSPKQDLKNNSRSEMCSRQVSRISNGETSGRNSLLSSQNFASIPYLNMSLSRLNIAHESLDNEESEERDVVYSDCTLPRRFSRKNNNNVSSLLRGNSYHMSFRRPKKRDNKI